MFEEFNISYSFTVRFMKEIINGAINSIFVATDVAIAIGYSKSSAEHISRLLKNVSKGITKRELIITSKNGVKSKRYVTCLTLEGLYEFLDKSRKPLAKEFKKYIEQTIVPSFSEGETLTPPASTTTTHAEDQKANKNASSKTSQSQVKKQIKKKAKPKTKSKNQAADSSIEKPKPMTAEEREKMHQRFLEIEKEWKNFEEQIAQEDGIVTEDTPPNSDTHFRKELIALAKNPSNLKSVAFRKWLAGKVVPRLMDKDLMSYWMDYEGSLTPRQYEENLPGIHMIYTNPQGITCLGSIVKGSSEKAKSIWYVAEDVISFYGYSKDDLPSIMNTIMKDCDPHWIKKLSIFNEPEQYEGLLRYGDTLCFSEEALYYFMLSTNQPNAKPFNDWIDYEVLPQLKSPGVYDNLPKPDEQ